MTESLLTVVMSCYNQAETVAQAIESVLMQKTDFPVRLIVTDDRSTKDGSVGIIRDYAVGRYGIIATRYDIRHNPSDCGCWFRRIVFQGKRK